jgi:UDP-N-acetylmuramoyl-L-alanyl-D-glutamate--2,6-diaminopimelate ligase
VLTSVREHVSSSRLRVLFGCGGDRDRTKRPKMGEIAARLADEVIITSDNPRSEDPQSIIKEIMAGVPTSTNVKMVVDRKEAIQWALDSQQPQDLLLLCGKGHETEQIWKSQKIKMDEFEICRKY